MNFENLFSKEEINTGRQIEFDIIKAVAIIFMITVHVFLRLHLDESNSVVWFVDYVSGMTLAAPIFMFSMGLGWAYTRHNTFHDLTKRGCYLLILGIVLSFLRSIVISPFLNLNSFLILVLIGLSDILAFAGLSFILFALLKKFNMESELLLIAIVFSLFSTLGQIHIPMDDNIMTYIYGLFINTNLDLYTINFSLPSSFPLLTWFIFPVAGYEFAKLLRRCNNKNKFYTQLIPISIICIIIFAILDNLTGHCMYTSNSNYYHHTIFASIHCIATAILCLGISHFLAPYIPNKIISLIKILSSHITEIYVFSWLLLVYSLALITYFFGLEVIFGEVNLGIAFLYTFIIILLSVLLAMKYRKSKIKDIIKIL